MKDIESGLRQKLDEQEHKAAAQKSDWESELSQAQCTIETLQGDIVSLRKAHALSSNAQMVAKESAIAALESDMSKCEKDFDTKVSEIEHMTKQLNRSQKQLSLESRMLQALRVSQSKSDDKLSAMDKTKAHAQERAVTLAAECASLSDQMRRLQSVVQEAEVRHGAAMSKKGEELRLALRDVDDHSSQLAALREKSAADTASAKQLGADHAALQATLDDTLRAAMADKQAAVSSLEADAEKAAQSAQTQVAALMSELEEQREAHGAAIGEREELLQSALRDLAAHTAQVGLLKQQAAIDAASEQRLAVERTALSSRVDDLQAAKTASDSTRTRVATLESHMAALTKQHAAFMRKKEECLQSAVDDLRGCKEQLAAVKRDAAAECSALQDELGVLRAEAATRQATASALTLQMAAAHEQYTAETSDLRLKNASAEQMANDMQAHVDRMGDHCKELQASEAATKAQMAVHRQHYASTLKELEDALKASAAELVSSREAHKCSADAIASAQTSAKRCKEVESELGVLQRKIAQAEEEATRRVAMADTLENGLVKEQRLRQQTPAHSDDPLGMRRQHSLLSPTPLQVSAPGPFGLTALVNSMFGTPARPAAASTDEEVHVEGDFYNYGAAAEADKNVHRPSTPLPVHSSLYHATTVPMFKEVHHLRSMQMGAVPAKEVAALVSEQTATLALELDKSASQQARLADENASLKQSIERQRQQVTDLEQMLDARADTIKTTTARLTGCAQDYAAAKANLGRRNAAVEAAERGRAHAQKEGARLRAAASAAEACSQEHKTMASAAEARAQQHAERAHSLEASMARLERARACSERTVVRLEQSCKQLEHERDAACARLKLLSAESVDAATLRETRSAVADQETAYKATVVKLQAEQRRVRESRDEIAVELDALKRSHTAAMAAAVIVAAPCSACAEREHKEAKRNGPAAAPASEHDSRVYNMDVGPGEEPKSVEKGSLAAAQSGCSFYNLSVRPSGQL